LTDSTPIFLDHLMAGAHGTLSSCFLMLLMVHVAHSFSMHIFGLQKMGLYSGYQVFNNCIVRTTDYGATWIVDMDSLIPYTNGLQRVHFNDSVGIIGTRGRYILLTEDGGQTWKQDSIVIPEETVRSSYAVLVSNAGYLACVKTAGGNGEIALFEHKSMVITDDVQQRLILYPNPVATHIDVTSFRGLHVQIVDALGRVQMENADIIDNRLDCTKLGVGLYSFIIHEIHEKNGGVLSSKFIKK
jgi:hypothetical protein